jgi:hypothetical protein
MRRVRVDQCGIGQSRLGIGIASHKIAVGKGLEIAKGAANVVLGLRQPKTMILKDTHRILSTHLTAARIRIVMECVLIGIEFQLGRGVSSAVQRSPVVAR